MKTKTNVKAGGVQLTNHNETLLRASRGLKVRTQVKAGGGSLKATRGQLKVDRGGRGHLTTPPPVG